MGAAIKKCGVPREELFITTKLWVQDASYEGAKKAFEDSLKKLGLEYLDLYLIHQPMGDYQGAYRAMEELYKEGRIRAIGAKYGKSAAQTALRWNVQRGVVVIPKSVHKDRMKQNMDIWDFALGEEDMAEIAKLDIGHSEIVDHFSPAFVKMLHGMKIHE